MKAFLMFPDGDFDTAADLPPQHALLTKDLELAIVLEAMAAGDPFLYDIARRALLVGVDDPAVVRYRQAILADCMARPEAVRAAYAVAVEAIEGERHIWGGLMASHPASLLHRSVDVLQLFMGQLRRLRDIAEQQGPACHSPGLTRLFAMLTAELDEPYLTSVADHLRRLRLDEGLVMTAELGAGNRGGHYVLRKRTAKRTWRERLGLWERSVYVYEVPDRDQAGAEALQELRGRGVALAAGALAESTDHILDFFRLMRAELGFYIACLNLKERLDELGAPTGVPEPLPPGEARLQARGLYDVALRLRSTDPVVGNDLDADDRRLMLVTGANRGGKSTFLRSLGQAQLMLGCGMFVAADRFSADLRPTVFTHFKREEDIDLRSGKLDEELARMSGIVDGLDGASLVLLNESFASTNEREGSEIARQIVRALVEAGVKVGYVTHMYDLAHGFEAEGRADALFLRAQRLDGGDRTFRILPGEALPTSFGEDVYRRIFGPPIESHDGDAAEPRAEATAAPA